MFEIGKITKPQGIRGEVRVYPTTDDPSRFSLLVGQDVTLENRGASQVYKIQQARQHKNIVLMQLQGVTTRNMAESLVGYTVCIQDSQALPLEEGEYFVRDLIGLKVETENGEVVGELTKVLNTNANDVYVITSPEGDAFMIPAIKSVVLAVSIPENKMVVHMMEGLRDLKV